MRVFFSFIIAYCVFFLFLFKLDYSKPQNELVDVSHSDRNQIVEINLSAPHALPSFVKLHGSEPKKTSNQEKNEETLEIIIRPGNKSNDQVTTSAKPLWRKREVVRQERTIHYTTLDDEGGLQELVEKETTQTEVLHMECKETGEFAHRETTDYEQVETFNNEVSTISSFFYLSLRGLIYLYYLFF